MPVVRLLGFLLSLALHAAFAVPFLTLAGSTALHSGTGDDLFTIEQGIAIEGLVKLGEAEAATEAQEMPLAEASQARPPMEEVKAFEPSETATHAEQEAVKENDPLEVITAKEVEQRDLAAVEESRPEALKPEELKPDNKPVEQPVMEPEPPQELDEPRLKQVMAAQQIEQFAVQEQQSSAEEKEGGQATLKMAYLGKLRMHLERHKVRPQAKATGTAVVKFTIDPSGKILSHEITTSSGSKKLDDAAIATIERSAPFPPFPDGVTQEPVVVSVPFKFRAGR
jgi:periplasmic protein TonB